MVIRGTLTEDQKQSLIILLNQEIYTQKGYLKNSKKWRLGNKISREEVIYKNNIKHLEEIKSILEEKE